MNERTCCLCLLKGAEIDPFVAMLREKYPEVDVKVLPLVGSSQMVFRGKNLDLLVREVEEKFPSFFYGDGKIEEALLREFVKRGKTLALAESCTGGAAAAKLVSVPGSSKYLVGSIVAYSNGWKERFLQVSRTTLERYGAVSREAVIEMAEGLLRETEADYIAAISGFAGPDGTGIGNVYIAIGERGGKIDAGLVFLGRQRQEIIDLAVETTLGALWRRLVHNTATFS